jgi:hypothetical protein
VGGILIETDICRAGRASGTYMFMLYCSFVGAAHRGRPDLGDEKKGHFKVEEKVFMTEEEKKKKGGFLQAIKEFVYGVAAHDSARFALKTRASMEHLFILITMGDMLGVPILPPYYSLRLLPYVVPQISTWKRRMLREKDLTDALA